METALTCSPNSQLMLLFLVKNALELTELLAQDHGSNNTIMPGSSSSRRRQISEEGGLSPRRVSVRLAAPLLPFVYSEEEEHHIGRGVQEETRHRRRRRRSRPRGSANTVTSPRVQMKDCTFFPPTLSFQIYSPLWLQVQTQRQRITHFKPQCALYKARVTDKNHLWCLLGCVNSLL